MLASTWRIERNRVIVLKSVMDIDKIDSFILSMKLNRSWTDYAGRTMNFSSIPCLGIICNLANESFSTKFVEANSSIKEYIVQI